MKRKQQTGAPFSPPRAPGIPVDAGGGPTVDPTRNVLDLVFAAGTRQDDLRESNDRRVNAEIGCLREISNMRAEHAKTLSDLRAAHAMEIGTMERGRLDSIRQVDRDAVSTEAARALAAINTLASATTTTAETLRTAVAQTAQTMATATGAVVAGLTERIAALEKTSYLGAGRSTVADPQIEILAAEVRKLALAGSGAAGKSEGISASWAVLIGAGMLAAALFGPSLLGRSTPPQIIYAPPPVSAPVAPR